MTRKIEEYWSLTPSRFRFLESMVLDRRLCEHAAEPYNLTLTLVDEPTASSNRACFRFYGVFGLKVGDIDGLKGLLFEVRDVSDRQMEGLRYRVIDAENGCIVFYCLDFSFEVLGRNPG
ncbi:hypothetical protein L6R53_06445 [Myxococcota bacterium]|nr:hypothetical protein [Myxococcota bacterium]